jgi:hypothetical protein
VLKNIVAGSRDFIGWLPFSKRCHPSLARYIKKYEYKYRMLVSSFAAFPSIDLLPGPNAQQTHDRYTIQMTATRVGIIGGGICGPVMAMLLKLKGYSPIIYERWPDVKDRGLGIG